MKSLSLRTKFILAFLTASLVAIGLVGIFTSQFSRRLFQSFIIDNLIEDYASIVQEYYETNFTLNGIESALRYSTTSNAGQFDELGRPGIILISPNQIIIIGDSSHPSGTSLARKDISEAHPIEVNGRTIAYIAIITPAFQPSPQETQFIKQTNRALSYASLAAIFFAIILGLLFTRTLFKSHWQVLNQALGKMEQGELLQQVQETSDDELGEVITGFYFMKCPCQSNQHRKQMTADTLMSCAVH